MKKTMFGNEYNPNALKDVKGEELHDCDIVDTICGPCVIMADYGGLYLNDAVLLDEEQVKAYNIIRKKPTMNVFAVRLDCPSPCAKCLQSRGCVGRNASINSRYAIIDEHCTMYAEYYLMKLEHDNKSSAK